MKKKINIILAAIVIISGNCYSQNKINGKTVTDFSFNLDSSRVLEFNNILPIGLTIHLNNGKIKKTKGLNAGDYPWEHFNIVVENAILSDGSLKYNTKTVYQNGHQIKISVSPLNNPSLKKEYKISIPYLTSFNIYYSKKNRITAGSTIPIYIQAQFNNSKIYTTDKKRKDGMLDWQNFQLSLNDSRLKSPYIVLPNPINIFYENLLIKGTYKPDTSIIADLSIPVSYKDTYNLYCDGKNGRNGRRGKNAFGLSGVNGNDGYNGEDGINGENGKNIDIFIESLFRGKDTLLMIQVLSDSSLEKFILNTHGGNLVLYSNGGNGGKGGNGGAGYYGLDASKAYDAGYGGNGGDGGYGGDGGNGGEIITYADTIANKFIDNILLQNNGGAGGKGGKGGNGGIGGYKECEKDCNTNGYNGANGIDGKTGDSPEPINYVISKKDVKELMKINSEKYGMKNE